MTDFDRLFSSRPVNRQAGMAVSKSDSYEPKINKCRETWDAPLKCRALPDNVENLVGRKFGKFTVVGLAERKTADRASWLVRCVCGKYEVRRSKAIKNEGNIGDQCQYCKSLINLKLKDWENQFGTQRAWELRDKELGVK